MNPRIRILTLISTNFRNPRLGKFDFPSPWKLEAHSPQPYRSGIASTLRHQSPYSEVAKGPSVPESNIQLSEIQPTILSPLSAPLLIVHSLGFDHNIPASTCPA